VGQQNHHKTRVLPLCQQGVLAWWILARLTKSSKGGGKEGERERERDELSEVPWGCGLEGILRDASLSGSGQRPPVMSSPSRSERSLVSRRG
jgi:hypothetical protein